MASILVVAEVQNGKVREPSYEPDLYGPGVDWLA